jgi:hypothetical protein
LLTSDPFEDVERICEALSIEVSALRIRLHDALLSANNVIALGQTAFNAVASVVSRAPEAKIFPATPLRFGEAATAPILVVNNEEERMGQQALDLLTETFPGERFVRFDASGAFKHNWKVMIQLGMAESSLPGARLSDAWLGEVPVLQLVNPIALNAQRKRRSGDLSGVVIEHGRTGLLAATVEELVQALGEFLLDALPARAVARGAKRRIDPTAEWDVLLKTILQ